MSLRIFRLTVSFYFNILSLYNTVFSICILGTWNRDVSFISYGYVSWIQSFWGWDGWCRGIDWRTDRRTDLNNWLILNSQIGRKKIRRYRGIIHIYGKRVGMMMTRVRIFLLSWSELLLLQLIPQIGYIANCFFSTGRNWRRLRRARRDESISGMENHEAFTRLADNIKGWQRRLSIMWRSFEDIGVCARILLWISVSRAEIWMDLFSERLSLIERLDPQESVQCKWLCLGQRATIM